MVVTPAVELMGLQVSAVTEQETIDAILDAVGRGEGGWICPVNVDVLRQWVASAEVRELIAPADLVVADGAPMVWASRLAGTPLPERVAGSSLIVTLPASAAARGASLFFLGGNEGTARRAADILLERHRDLRIVGTLCPPFGFERDEAQRRRIESELRAAAPDVVFVGLGFPKQEHLIQRLREVLPRAWFVSCGVSFSFVSGEVHRAPPVLQRLGLEWLHRLAQEPRRLARRYLVDGLPFVARLFADAGRRRLGHPSNPA